MKCLNTALSQCLITTFTIVAGLLILSAVPNAQAVVEAANAISAGNSHSCAVASGSALCWGSNTYGQLGNDTLAASNSAVKVSGMTSGVATITVGQTHTCALTTSGGLKCWGQNNYGQLGDGSTTDRTTPVNVSGLTSGVASITAGDRHTCAITTAGGAKCWGYNTNGQLGDGSNTNRYSPVDVSGLTNDVSSIAAGQYHTCAVTISGSLKCWGYNLYGQLGTGDTTPRTTPADVSGLTSGVSSIATGQSHTCAVTTAGGAKCWGLNNFGQLGDGSTTQQNTAVDVTSLTSDVASIATGSFHTCARTSSGEVKCWGANDSGQVEVAPGADKLTPATVTGLSNTIAISLGTSHSCAITQVGNIQCWGDNSYGQLGDGATDDYFGAVFATMGDKTASGGGHTCILDSNGAARCWGNNNYGQLGNGNSDPSFTPTAVSGLFSGVTAIATGQNHTCALATSGHVKCWGNNPSGQLGDGSITDKATPSITVSGLSAGVTVAAGWFHTCAVTSAGGAKCWGGNSYGQLGDGTTIPKNTASVIVTGLSTDVASITAGYNHTCAVTTAGGVKCWGGNSYGQLGDGTTTQRNNPVDIIGLTSGISSVTAGYSHTCALTTAGGAKCWGLNNFGQLGDGTTNTRTTPIAVTGLTSGVTSIAAGSTFTCAITSADEVKCWGQNEHGQLGDGTRTNSNRPVTVHTQSSFNDLTNISAGQSHACVASTNNVKCWGSNQYGQLAQGRALRDVNETVTVSGTITHGGTPLEGVSVSAQPFGGMLNYPTVYVATTAGGLYSIPLPSGMYHEITPALSSYAFNPTSLVETILSSRQADFAANLVYTLSGIVSVDGAPFYGATVYIDALHQDTTDGSGYYSITLPAATYSVEIRDTGANFANPYTVIVTNNTIQDFNNTYELYGSVTYGASPLSGVTIDGGVLGSRTTNTSGNYVFGQVAYGTNYTLTPYLADHTFAPTNAVGTLTTDSNHSFTATLNATTTSSSTTTTSTTIPSTTISTTIPTTLPTTSTITTAPSTTSIIATLSGTPRSELTAGAYHTCAINNATGAAECWGNNDNGRLGDGTTTERKTPTVVTGLASGMQRISAGAYHTCAVSVTGGAKCWGYNTYGQLGDSSTTEKHVPATVVGLTANVSAISTGVFHTCAVTTAGSAKCWGYNGSGQLGDGSTTNRHAPVNVAGMTSGITAISAGLSHTCALRNNGRIQCWGLNNYGQLGNGTTASTQTPVYAGTSLYQAVSVGNYHSCGLLTTGFVTCWGLNSSGQLGNNTSINSLVPTPISPISGIASLSAGSTHTCAVTSGGSAYCWGSNLYGQLGDGSNEDHLFPNLLPSTVPPNLTAIDAGGRHTCALNYNAAVICWGHNASGQLGNGATTSRYAPTTVENARRVRAATSHTCATNTGGQMHCWGSNYYGELGDGTNENRPTPTNVSGASVVNQFAVGRAHTCALQGASYLKCWGDNTAGQLGNGTNAGSNFPVTVSMPTGSYMIISLVAGSYHNCALSSAGAVRCWGDNSYGQLGDGTTISRNTPVGVTGLTGGATQLWAGDSRTCALMTSGELRCWGLNNFGQLGDGTTVNRYTPTNASLVSGPVAKLAIGRQHTCAMSSSGRVFCWGRNSSGQLGDGTTVDRLAPAEISQLGSAASDITAGASHSCALMTTGAIKCWGDNSSGQLGDGTDNSRVLPTLVNSTTPFSLLPGSLSAGSWHTCAILSSGMLNCWGDNTSGQLGESAPSVTPVVENVLLSGRITADGSPVAGVRVVANPNQPSQSDMETVTDSDGRYSFQLVLNSSYRITPNMTGYTFSPTSPLLNNVDAPVTQNFGGIPETYTISGRIMNGNSVLRDVTVAGGSLGNKNTDSTGRYTFTNVKHGTVYSVVPQVANYQFTPPMAGGVLVDDATHNFSANFTEAATTVPTTTTIRVTTSAATTSVPHTTTATTSTTTTPSTTVPTNTTTSIAPTTAPTDNDFDKDGLTNSDEIKYNTDPLDADSDDDGVADGEEVLAGTNARDPGSRKPKLGSTLCTEWNGFLGGMRNIMEHVNVGSKKLRITTVLNSMSGLAKDRYEFNLNAGQQLDVLVHDLPGRAENSYGVICSSYQGNPLGSLDGQMVYYKLDGARDEATGSGNVDFGNIDFAFALPLDNPLTGTSHLIYNNQQPSLNPEDAGNLIANWLQIVNVDSKRLKGTLYLYNADGKLLKSSVEVSLRSNTRFDYDAHRHGANTIGMARFVPEDGNGKYQFRSVRYLYDNAGTRDSFASAYSIVASTGNGQLLAAPFDLGGGRSAGRSAIVEIANTASKRNNVNVRVFDQSGKRQLLDKVYNMKGRSTLQVNLDKLVAAMPEIERGIVMVKGEEAGSIIGSVLHYKRSEKGGIENMYALDLREAIGQTLTSSYNTFLNQGCDIQLVNPTGVKENVTIWLKPSASKTRSTEYKLLVPARGMATENICRKEPANTYGLVTVNAAKKGKVTGVVIRRGAENRYNFATALR